MDSEAGRRAAAAFLAAQATFGAIWWLALLTVPAARTWFELIADRRGALDALVIADVALVVVGSAAAAVAVGRGSPSAPLVTAFTAGAVAYATLTLLGWVLIEGSPAFGLLPMAIASVATTLIAVGTHRAMVRRG